MSEVEGSVMESQPFYQPPVEGREGMSVQEEIERVGAQLCGEISAEDSLPFSSMIASSPPPTTTLLNMDPPTLPDFMTALNMQPALNEDIGDATVNSMQKIKQERQERQEEMTTNTVVPQKKEGLAVGPGPKEVLIEKFKKGNSLMCNTVKVFHYLMKLLT